jgi:hypothetical protein
MSLSFFLSTLAMHLSIKPLRQVSSQIAENICLFNQHVDEHRLFETVQANLKQQIIAAVEYRYLQLLEDPDFGFSDVAPRVMLQHLRLTYGQVTPDDIEQNRSLLSAEWNPDDPIEDVWLRLRDCQGYATAANEPITNNAAIRLTLTVFKKTGVFASAVDKWRDKAVADQTIDTFKTHFNFENKERLRKLTAQTAGYHGAHQADLVPPSPARAPANAMAATPPGSSPPSYTSSRHC